MSGWVRDSFWDNWQGTYQSYKGAKYEGSWEENLPHREGYYEWDDGSSYNGQFHHGKLSGKGIHKSLDGSELHGDWIEGILNGKATFFCKGIEVLSGVWKNGTLVKWTGEEEYANKLGTTTFIGLVPLFLTPNKSPFFERLEFKFQPRLNKISYKKELFGSEKKHLSFYSDETRMLAYGASDRYRSPNDYPAHSF